MGKINGKKSSQIPTKPVIMSPKTTVPPAGKGPLKITKLQVDNFQGGDAALYGLKTRLFMMGVGTFSGESSFYKTGEHRDAEMTQLAQAVAVKDPEWMRRFLPWLRTTANMRTSSITMACDVAKVWLDAKIPGGRALINSVLVRADEPGEALAYWVSKYGKQIPKPVKRGIADAATRLYNEFTLLKWDSDKSAYRFADVIELTHPDARDAYQGRLFKHAIDVRHGRGVNDVDGLPMIAHNKLAHLTWNIKGATPVIPTSEQLKAAGMSWEDVLSALGSKVDKKKLWEALIPNMGYMALLRNLRNMEQAGISMRAIAAVQARLADPTEVARSKQLPMRFLSAYRALQSDTFKYPVDQALQASLANIPRLDGRTLILVDTSGSMHSDMSDRSGLKRWDAAVIFGLALAGACDRADVVSFSDTYAGSVYHPRIEQGTKVFERRQGENLLKSIERWEKDGYFIGGGTDTEGAVQQNYAGHDRVFILTDEESSTTRVWASVPDQVKKYTFNLAGYGHSHSGIDVKNHVALSGLTDSMFSLIPLIEAGQDGRWPF